MTVQKPPLFLARYRQVAEAAQQAETDFNREAEQRRAMLEKQRSIAWWRFRLLDLMHKAAAPLSERDDATDAALEAVFRELGWITGTLDDLPDADDPVADQLEPVAEAVHAIAHRRKPERPVEALMAEFEEWYRRERGIDFFALFAPRSGP